MRTFCLSMQAETSSPAKTKTFWGDEQINNILITYRHRINSDKYSHRASLQEIRDNDYNLNIPRYVDTFEAEEEIDLLAVRAERKLLKAQLAELEVQMDGYLKELGYGA